MYFFKEKKITDFYNNDAGKIQSIQIINGSNGNIVDVPNDDLDKITDFLSELRFTSIISSQYSGWQYRYIINTDENSMTIEFCGEICKINGVQYKITKNKGNIDNIYNDLLK